MNNHDQELREVFEKLDYTTHFEAKPRKLREPNDTLRKVESTLKIASIANSTIHLGGDILLKTPLTLVTVGAALKDVGMAGANQLTNDKKGVFYNPIVRHETSNLNPIKAINDLILELKLADHLTEEKLIQMTMQIRYENAFVNAKANTEWQISDIEDIKNNVRSYMANNETVLREYQDEMQQKLSMAIKASDGVVLKHDSNSVMESLKTPASGEDYDILFIPQQDYLDKTKEDLKLGVQCTEVQHMEYNKEEINDQLDQLLEEMEIVTQSEIDDIDDKINREESVSKAPSVSSDMSEIDLSMISSHQSTDAGSGDVSSSGKKSFREKIKSKDDFDLKVNGKSL